MGKVAWITGVSQGLGQVMVDGLIEQGWSIAGLARNASAIADLQKKHASGHYFEAVDVCDDQAVANFCQKANQELGAPDLLINNAAIINKPNPLWKISEEEFSQVIDINIKGGANVIRHAVPLMNERGTGVIVNFSSGWGRSTSPEVAPYCATKWAIEGLTQSLAQELPLGLAAVALNPGIINTEMLQTCFGGSAANYETPAEWKAGAIRLLTGLGAKDNGASLTV